MNRTWMHQRLESFKALCETYDRLNRQTGYEFSDGHEKLIDEMSSQLPTIREILKCLDPALAKDVDLPGLYGASSSAHATQQGLGILRDQDDWTANLAPDAPSLLADQFHPHVWAAASVVGHRAVQGSRGTGGSVAISAYCQEGHLAAVRAGTGSPGGLMRRK